MKNLIYKELKLSVHPICYIFCIAFPLMALIPNYPLFVGLLYVATSYPILFLGANKGQQSNDLLYTTLLPVRKKDIVLARLITVTILLFVAIAITLAIMPITDSIHQAILAADPEGWGDEYVGLGYSAIFSLIGLTLICYGVYNVIFFLFFYKNGKAILAPTLIGIFLFIIMLACLTLALPMAVPEFEQFASSTIGNITIGFGGLAIYLILGFLTYKKASKELEAVNL